MWTSFGIWEVLAGFAATMARAEYTEPGGGGDNTILAVVAIGATLLWWTLYFFGTALADQVRRS
jgi:hypothetical protein